MKLERKALRGAFLGITAASAVAMTAAITAAITAATTVATTTPARAAYPEQPIIFILPVSAGGATDVAARTYAPHLAACLAEDATIVVTNMPGGSSVIGISAVAASPADGITFGTLNMPNLVTTTITAERSYTVESFDFLGNVVGSTSAFSVAKGSEIQSLADLVEKARDGKVRVGIGTIGSDDHLAFLRFGRLAGVEFEFIPFGDEARARNALLGGNADVIGMSANAALGFKDEIQVLGAAAPDRLDYAPEIPTFREQGFDLVSGSMHVLGVPKGVPEDVLGKLRGCVDGLRDNETFIAEATERNLALKFLNAEETAEAIKAEDAELRAIWETNPWQPK